MTGSNTRLRRYVQGSSDVNDGPRSECTNPTVPHNENKESRHLITVDDSMLGQGKANVKHEYSSTAMRRYLFLVVLFRVPLKSMLRCLLN